MSDVPPEMPESDASPWSVVDLFSCGGGTSAGFARRPEFRIIAAVDLELAKPSGGASDCNATYRANHAVVPMNRDMMTFAPRDFAEAAGLAPGELDVMICCAPCTHLSRANPDNHRSDRPENSLIARSGAFAAHLLPQIFLMENARELIMGNYRHHHGGLVRTLEQAGYHVRSEIHFLDRFGLPQVRERALVVASRIGQARSLEDLWAGWSVRPEVTTVRIALRRLADWRITQPDDPEGDVFPGMGPAVLNRLAATPHDGGGWVDLARDPRTRGLLTKDCLRRWNAGDPGSHPDVYGRMALDRPAPTVKRECGHVGNGRYAHPTEDRLLTVREMATLQGFPFDYRFPARAVTNRYRHIGDAVPPLIAFQMSALVKWMKTGTRPRPVDFAMPNTTLRLDDIVASTRPVAASA